MRDFCLRHGFDPGNYSRLERGLFPPPQREELLERYANAVGLVRGSDDWLEFFDTAAASRTDYRGGSSVRGPVCLDIPARGP